MVFAPGGLIDNNDYNTIVNALNNIYGLGTGSSGYGGISTLPPFTAMASDLPTKADMDSIQNEDWLVLRQAFIDTSAHQGPALPLPSLPSVANLEGPGEGDGPDKIGSSLDPNFFNFGHINHLTQLNANKDLFAGETFSLDPAVISVRTTSSPWGVKIEHQVKITFTSQDDARAHFNTGGDFRIEATRTLGAATPHNAAWTALLAAAGNIYVFDSADYFGLTTTFATVFLIEDTTLDPYDIGLNGPITWRIQAKTDTIVDPGGRGGKGSVITINSSFLDQHIAHPGDLDIVDGTFTSSMRSRRSSVIFAKPVPVMVVDQTNPPFPFLPAPIDLNLGF